MKSTPAVQRPSNKVAIAPRLPRLHRPKTELGTGWLPDLPDFRDYSPETESVRTLFRNGPPRTAGLPAQADLRAFCSPIEDQGQLGSCTAQAVIGLVEYFERRTHHEHLDASARFIYKVTRKLYGFEGDTGAYVRGAMKALKLFGACPEEFWPYSISEFEVEPPAFCYAFGQSYKAVQYYRIHNDSPSMLIEQLKASLANGLPFAFGFSVYSSIWDATVFNTGHIPFPGASDRLEGGHAVMAVGYDDDEERFIIRNSWGMDWGENGYGTLPYEYVRRNIADDFWVLVTSEYVSLLGL